MKKTILYSVFAVIAMIAVYLLVDKHKENKGKAVVLGLWFTTCGPCIQEIPALNQLKTQYGDDVVFLAMTFDPPSCVQKFLTKYPFDYRILYADEAYFGKLTTAFPTTFFTVTVL